MKTESFKKLLLTEDILDDLDPNCMRLKCGHAFHLTCAMGAIRTVGNCPSCRDPVVPATNEEDVENSEEEEDVYTMFEISRELLRKTDPDIRKAAKEFEGSLKEYKKNVNVIKKERRVIVSQALESFTKKRKAQHAALSKNVHKKMLALKRLEKKKLQLTGANEEEINIYIEAVSDLDYCAKEYMATSFDCAPDPLFNRFWKG